MINTYKKNESVKSIIITISLILASQMLTPYLNIITHLLMIIYAIRGSKVTCIKVLFIRLLLSNLNTDVFKRDFVMVPTLRWIILFICIYKLLNKSKVNVKKEIWIIVLFGWFMYTSIISIVNSYLPIVSLFKVTVFTVGFIAVYIGFINTKTIYNWYQWIIGYFITILLWSVPLLISSKGYFREVAGFRGIIYHPNSFAIIMAIMITIFIITIKKRILLEHKTSIIIYIIIGTVLLFKSEARTSIFAVSALILILMVNEILRFIKDSITLKVLVLSLLFTCISLLVFIKFNDKIINFTNSIIFKYGTTDILASSEHVLEASKKEIEKNFIFGNGFGVDNSEENEKSLVIELSHPIEKRNIFLALLGETGIIGTSMFILFILMYMGKYDRFKFSIDDSIIFTCILVNMGEMIFFSGNSIGMLVWLVFGLYKSYIVT